MTHPIWPMAGITVVASALLWGALLRGYSRAGWRYLRLIPFGLPLSAFTNLAVKGPLARAVGSLFGVEVSRGVDVPLLFLGFLLVLSPLIEEVVKVVPLALGWVRRHVEDHGSAMWTGMALGIGFGLGEAFFLAYAIAAGGQLPDVPWYAFTGFLGERLFVTFMHGVMTAVLLVLAQRGRPLPGYLAAVGLHTVLNLGAVAFQAGLVPEWVASAWFVPMIIGAAVLFERVRPHTGVVRDATADEDAGEIVYYHEEE